MMFDVCIVGHVTRDRIRTVDGERSGVGGVASYAALALRSLGYRVAVVTRVADIDREVLLTDLRAAGIEVYCGASVQTSTFRCVYDKPSPDERTLSVDAVAEPFAPADLESVSARWFYLGPLTSRDMSVDFVLAAARRSTVVGGQLALDAQGMVRRVDGREVRATRPDDVPTLLAHVDVLKVDEDEAAMLAGDEDPVRAARFLRSCGPGEVLLTNGSQGSLVCDAAGLHPIDAVPGTTVDATGCGDTYLAAYLSRRLRCEDPVPAARFASAAASLSLETAGPLRATEAEVLERMARGKPGNVLGLEMPS